MHESKRLREPWADGGGDAAKPVLLNFREEFSSMGSAGLQLLSISRPACSTLHAKKLECSGAFLSRCIYVCACALRVSDSLNGPVHEGMRSVAGP